MTSGYQVAEPAGAFYTYEVVQRHTLLGLDNENVKASEHVCDQPTDLPFDT